MKAPGLSKAMRAALEWVVSWWKARQRGTDIAVLWPACCAFGEDMARAVFMWHAENDPAYSLMTHEQLIDYVSALPYPPSGSKALNDMRAAEGSEEWKP